jgi:hypothetical protein
MRSGRGATWQAAASDDEPGTCLPRLRRRLADWLRRTEATAWSTEWSKSVLSSRRVTVRERCRSHERPQDRQNGRRDEDLLVRNMVAMRGKEWIE